jgi:hypothetical protein
MSRFCREITDAIKNRAQVLFATTLITSTEFRRSPFMASVFFVTAFLTAM